MTKAEIIEQCQDLTEQKANGRIDVARTLELRIARFMKEKDFWWRRRVASFKTAAGQPLYTLARQNPAIIGVDKIRRMRLIDSSGKRHKISAIWDEDAVMDAQECADQGMPTAFTMEPGATGVIRLVKIPDGVYTVRFAFLGAYVMDESKTEFTDFVPETMHFAVVDGLKMDLMEFLYGAESNKYTVAAGVYQDSVSKCFLPGEFTSERVDTFTGSELGNAAVSSAT